LTEEYLEEIRRRKNRYMGQWTGTNGAMAADCHRLLTERETLLKEIKDMQDELDTLPRAAHAALDLGPTDTTTTEEIPVDWILRGERALRDERPEEPVRRPLGASVTRQDDAQLTAGRVVSSSPCWMRSRACTSPRRWTTGKYEAAPGDHFAITVRGGQRLFRARGRRA
jgi:hypothetical protein